MQSSCWQRLLVQTARFVDWGKNRVARRNQDQWETCRQCRFRLGIEGPAEKQPTKSLGHRWHFEEPRIWMSAWASRESEYDLFQATRKNTKNERSLSLVENRSRIERQQKVQLRCWRSRHWRRSMAWNFNSSDDSSSDVLQAKATDIYLANAVERSSRLRQNNWWFGGHCVRTKECSNEHLRHITSNVKLRRKSKQSGAALRLHPLQKYLNRRRRQLIKIRQAKKRVELKILGTFVECPLPVLKIAPSLLTWSLRFVVVGCSVSHCLVCSRIHFHQRDSRQV